MYNSHNKNPLHKKFLCQHCSKAFRTRQGLSGHIQFKHGAKQEPAQKDAMYILSKGQLVEIFGNIWELSKSDVQARQKILTKWLEVEALCDFLHIGLNDQDFKNYIIVSLAQLHSKET